MADADSHAAERGESPAEQLDRQWNELLQELRVLQTGLALLSGFLLTLPFQGRFSELDPQLRVVFLVAVASTTLATGLVVGPVVLHRSLFREHRKDTLVESSHRMTGLALFLLALTVVMVTWLGFGFVLGSPWGLVASGIAASVFTALWVILPRALAKQPVTPGRYGAGRGG